MIGHLYNRSWDDLAQCVHQSPSSLTSEADYSQNGFVSTHEIERLWLEQFDFAYREYDSFVFPMSVHPQVSGKPQVVFMHER